jgi:ABC-type sugar transport system permease subunit
MKMSKRMVVFFLLPAGIIYLLFFLLPTGIALYFSLFDWSGLGEDMNFIGIKNFVQLFSDQVFLLSLRNTLMILVVGLLIIFPLTFLLSVLINSGIKGKKFFRTMIFLPNVISTVALTTMWAFIYNPKFGLINNFFSILGLKALSKTLWLSSDMIFGSMLVAIIWLNVGFQLVLILAGMDKIPFEYYEAAQLEGANQWQIFSNITVPLLWDVISIAVVLWSISALKMFEFPYSFSGAYPPNNIWTIGINLYVMGFGKREPIYRLGYATAMGVVLLFIVIIVVLVLRRLMRREIYQY